MTGLAVTGTDTGVGKTVVSAAIAAYLRAEGVNVAAMKPVETGTPLRADAGILNKASGAGADIDDVCPVFFEHALAPAVAADMQRDTVQVERLDRSFERLTLSHDFVVVEGAGGLATPITWQLNFADLFARWRLPLLVVASDKLGVINHVALTLAAARAAGLGVLGVVLNVVDRSSALTSNRKALEMVSAAVPVIPFPYLDDARDISQLTGLVRSTGLAALLDNSRRSNTDG